MNEKWDAEQRRQVSNLLMEAADYFGATLTTADPRAWEHLLTYCPAELRAPSRASPTGTVSLEDAFDLGFALRGMLTGQTLEDGRAVCRTLASDLFSGLKIDASRVPGFDTADIAIVEAKAAIKNALMSESDASPASPTGEDGLREAVARDLAKEFAMVEECWPDYKDVAEKILAKTKVRIAATARAKALDEAAKAAQDQSDEDDAAVEWRDLRERRIAACTSLIVKNRIEALKDRPHD